MRKIFLLGLLLSLGCVTVSAQSPLTPLVGPLVAVNTAAQDRIVLYDVGSGGQRSLNLGNGWLMPWGFSANGCRLIYTMSDGLAFGRVYSAKLDGSDKQSLVQFDDLPPDAWGVWEPQPSPDGSLIAFSLL